jgi:hypothetical protein
VAVYCALRNCVLGLSLVFTACSVHDADRLNPLPISAGSSSGGGSGGVGGGVPGDAGGQSGGGAGGVGGSTGTGGSSGDAALADPTDAGDGTRCGDGLVTGSELCDTDIAADEPGACPTQCAPLSECVMRALNGTGCRAECVVLQAQCEGGDGCCPGNCMPSNDNDCSASCGDGIVQANEGETCEPEPSADAGIADAGLSPRCPEGCDDEDSCTTDVLSGSAMNCNVECAHVEITALADGDGCCPAGANTLTDSDCQPVCGNHVRERGEDCDSATGCNQECDLDYTTEQRHCLDTFAVTNEACALCQCTSCAPVKLACFEDGDQARGERCVDLQSCVRASGCFDSSCYCRNVFACVPPDGPCVPEVEAAAETTNVFDIDGRKMDTSYAIGRSYALDNCIATECASACE